VDYIFTEFFFNFISLYINLNTYVEFVFFSIFQLLNYYLPIFIKSLIGYCHFYYQLGYGLIFYIYIYRRRKAKKTKNWRSFYGNSIPNWFYFNISIFNKFLFNRNFILYLKSKITKHYTITLFWLNNLSNKDTILNKIKTLKKINLFKLYSWTPLFKKSSYISFLTLLKRFTKRK
jgi:hypothetical protein